MTGAVALVTGEIAAFAGYLAGEAMLPSGVPHASLGQPGVLRAVMFAGLYLTLVALLGLGAGVLVRRPAAAIAILVVVIYALPPLMLALPGGIEDTAEKLMPETIAENTLTAVRPEHYHLPPWLALGLLCLYVAAVLAAGTWRLSRRDA